MLKEWVGDNDYAVGESERSKGAKGMKCCWTSWSEECFSGESDISDEPATPCRSSTAALMQGPI